MSKLVSDLVDNKRMRFEQRQIDYIAKSHRDAVKAGYMEKGDVFHCVPGVFKDMDKAVLFLPSYDGEAWDHVPV